MYREWLNYIKREKPNQGWGDNEGFWRSDF